MKLKNLLFGAVAGLLLTACGGGSSPEDVTKSFVEALATGGCDKALEMAIDDAKANVQSQIDAGCTEYKSEIKSTECETQEETASCKCTETRDGAEQTYKYELKKVDGEWKVASFEKDFNLDGMGDMGDMGGE